MNSTQAQVLIVGAGPTGMTAALELSRMHIPVRLIEREAQPATTSRAIGVQARTLELFAQRGLAAPMLEQGNRGVAASIYGEGERLFHVEFAHNGSDYNFILFLSQANTEAMLRGALEKQGVAIEREVEFIALAQSEHSDSVKAILKHKDGSLEECSCAYLIDSEGAHSTSRITLNLPFKGKTRHEQYALGDLHMEGDLPSTDVHIFASELGFLALFPLGGTRFRLIASDTPSEPDKDAAPSLEYLQQRYDQRSYVPARFHDMIWSSTFRINSRMVDRLHVGRVFLGGDSAHIHSPAGGQGMNTGIQDMINLAWKLAFVLKGYADPKLLDTYTDDRIPVIHSVLTGTEDLTDAIGSENPLFRSVFSHIAPWIVGTEFIQKNATERMSQLSLHYRDSPLSVSHGVTHEVKAGDRIPNLHILSIGGDRAAMQPPKPETLQRLLSTDRFTLLFANLDDTEATNASVRTVLSPWKSLIETHALAPPPGQEEPFRKLFGSLPSMILVRPDGYAAFTGTDHSTERSTERSVDALATYLRNWFPMQAEE